MMRRSRLRVRRSVPIEQRLEVLQIQGAIPVHRLIGLLYRQIDHRAGTLHRRERPSMQLIGQVIAEGMVQDWGHGRKSPKT